MNQKSGLVRFELIDNLYDWLNSLKDLLLDHDSQLRANWTILLTRHLIDSHSYWIGSSSSSKFVESGSSLSGGRAVSVDIVITFAIICASMNSPESDYSHVYRTWSQWTQNLLSLYDLWLQASTRSSCLTAAPRLSTTTWTSTRSTTPTWSMRERSATMRSPRSPTTGKLPSRH